MTQLLENVDDVDSLMKIMSNGERVIRHTMWDTTHDKYEHLDSWYELFAGRIADVFSNQLVGEV